MTKLSSKKSVKKWFRICASVLLVFALAACGSSSSGGGNSHNDRISNAWVIAVEDLGPLSTSGIHAEIALMPQDDYIIADGSGHITESSFYTQSTGTYSVKAGGAFTLMVNGVTYEGILNSPTTGVITSPVSGIIAAITNATDCQGTQLGIALSGVSASFVVDIDASGAVTQNAIYSSDYDVTGGHIFCGDGISIGAVTTVDSGELKKFRLVGISSTPPPPNASGFFDDDGYHDGAAHGSFTLLPLII